MSVSAAARSSACTRSCRPASTLATKRVPSQAPAAPSASAAASPRPSAIPPAATTGTGATASTTRRNERQRRDLAPDVAARFPTLGDDDVDARRRPTRRASSALPTVQSDGAAGGVDRADAAAPGSPQKNETMRTPSSSRISRRSSCGHSRTRFPAKGRSVRAPGRSERAREGRPARASSPERPRPPALETAAVRPAVAATGACTMGRSIPSASQSGVRRLTVPRYGGRRRDEIREVAVGMSAARQPDEVGDERRVRSVAALVRGDAGQLEELVHVAGVEVEAVSSPTPAASRLRCCSSHSCTAKA